MEGKKIVFGFTKTLKKPQLVINQKQTVLKNKVQLINCLEGKEIKLVNKSDQPENKVLVIPLQDSSKSSRALESLKMRKAVLEGIEIESKSENGKTTTDVILDSKIDSLERRAIAELLQEARSDANGNMNDLATNSTLVVKPEDLVLDGAKEASLQDYENIPIQQFGMAMLRGMGLTDEAIKKKSIDDDILCPRPKGMGLGADKAIKRQPVLIPPEENEKLEIKKNAYVKILAGKHKSQYGQIEGFDDRTGRAIIKLALGSEKETLGEYLLQAVSKKEFQTYGKVINSAKYDEYKKKQEEMEAMSYIKQEENPFKVKNESQDKQKYKNEKFSSDDEHMFKSSSIKKEAISPDRFCNGKYGHIMENSKEKSYSGQMLDNRKHSTSQRNISSNRYYDVDKYDENRKTRKDNQNDYPTDNRNAKPRQRCRSKSTEYNARSRKESDSDSNDSSLERKKHKSSEKKSKKSKKNKHRYNSPSVDEKKHKKKTKKSRKSRSRSRSRHRR